MQSKSPAFQFYPDDWNNDINVIAMTAEEEGHYIRLCGLCWKHGYIPAGPEDIQRLLKSRCENLEKITKCFYKNPKNNLQLLHKRLEKERKKQKAWRLKSAKGGRKSKKNKHLNGENKDKGGVSTLTRVVEPKGNTMSLSLSLDSVSNSKSKDKSGAPPKNSRKKKNWTDGKPRRPDNPVHRILWFAKKASLKIRGAPLVPKYGRDGKNIKTLLAEPEVSEKLVLVALVAFFSDSRHRWLNEEVDDRDIGVFISMATYCLGEGLKILQRALARTKPEPPPPKAKEPVDPKLTELWDQCLEKIKAQISPEGFDAWFKLAWPRSLDDGLLTVAVPNQFYRKCLIENYRDLIEKTLHGIRDGPLLVDFCIDSELSEN